MAHILARPAAALILTLILVPEPAARAAEPSPRPVPPTGQPSATGPLATDPLAADPLASVARLDLATTVAAVLERNRDLEAARRAWQAAARRSPQVSALPDPEVMAGLAPLSVFSDEVDLGASLEVRQGLPWPGKLRLAGEAATAGAEAVRYELEAMRLELALAAAQLFYDLYLVDLSLTINDQHVRLLEELMATATNRYAAGLVPQQAPLQAEVELTHLHHRTITLGTARAVAAARLNALLHRDPALPLPPLAEPTPGEATAAGGEPDPALHAGRAAAAPADVPTAEIHPDSPLAVQWPEAAAVEARPELAAAEAEIRVRELAARLAELERKPDFGVSAGYSSMWMETDHRVMLGVTVSLPVWRERLAAAEAEAEAALAAARARREAAVDRIRSDVRQAVELAAEMAHVVGLYESRLLPASRDQVRAARSGFETGVVDFPTVIEAERNLRSVELAYQEARVGLLRRQAELERALGRAPGAPAPRVNPIAAPNPPEPDPAAPAAAGGAR